MTIVNGPVPGMSKSIVSTPAPVSALTWLIAQRSEPGLPSSRVSVTVKVESIVRASSSCTTRSASPAAGDVDPASRVRAARNPQSPVCWNRGRGSHPIVVSPSIVDRSGCWRRIRNPDTCDTEPGVGLRQAFDPVRCTTRNSILRFCCERTPFRVLNVLMYSITFWRRRNQEVLRVKASHGDRRTTARDLALATKLVMMAPGHFEASARRRPPQPGRSVLMHASTYFPASGLRLMSRRSGTSPKRRTTSGRR